MPTCRRKRVVLTQPSEQLLRALKSDPNKDVFYLEQTGEIFETYEAYAARMSFYRLKQFQCEVTGKSGLDYFQAISSERAEAETLHSRFSEPLKPVILKAVQFQVVGRLDHLVEAVYDRFKDRYFKGERVLVDLNGLKYYARVHTVYPPKYSYDVAARDANKPDAEGMDNGNARPIDHEEPHQIYGDLKIAVKEINSRDDPFMYYYWVHLTELERDKGDKGKSSRAADGSEMIGSLMEVQCGRMSRDRLSFSKSILRRFIRDCVDRDAAVASPWIVKPAIAHKYGVISNMPEDTRKDVEAIKKGEHDKRKKAWEDKDGPPNKKQKKMTAAQEEKGLSLLFHLQPKDKEAQDKHDQQRAAREEAEKIAAEKKKKKPIRYPTEDLDVRLNDKDIKAGMKLKRPVPTSHALPFNHHPGTFEAFLMTWNFLVVYGQPLHLSPFTLDEFEHAVKHSIEDIPCPLLAEVHSTLIYNLRTVAFARHSAVLSLLRRKEQLESQGLEDDEFFGVDTDQLSAAVSDIGNNWERVPLRFSEGREGWEEALVGCLKDHATRENFPRMREILTKLLFAPDPNEPILSDTTPSPLRLSMISTPRERYSKLPVQDRIAILGFMVNLAISSKAIHQHMESCEEQLTALRKEKIEVNRTKKQYMEEMSGLMGEIKEEQIDEDVKMEDPSDLSDVATSENGSDSGRSKKKPKDLRQKAQLQAHSKQREAARAKQASVKAALAEHRRLDEEVNKLERRLEGIERDFRKLLGGVRVKPMGKDRFYNRIWWFDGLGSSSLVASGGATQYGAGRIFVQGPSEIDLEHMMRRIGDEIPVQARRLEEEGQEGMLGPGDWAVYSDVEELESFLAWLNPKGHREIALKQAMSKWWFHISAGIRRRMQDLSAQAKLPEARRSARTQKVTPDISREPYMTWTNKKALNAT
ncbi:ATP-utilizing chromatin assembly and remodelling N-terminal-domain-containing protein [Rhodocollybia butyracea]|uniref:ATP-utilizing chromatin assembly and remodelling N-terminal-domain-containing protein n=1 Tax=Rhodocollybia butyracea TaxID=206335 RepID=A0A9P5U6S9_9AGAR|nr:ATP-utilizing chromatin assembly and remodelling N-terminal-domain-containing protein [Rhodocollybia butyracea]